MEVDVVGANDRVAGWAREVAGWIERVLAGAILVGVVVAGYGSAVRLAGMDWGSTETAYDLVYRVLALVIAVELARTLVTHELRAVLELLAFVIARKMLGPDLEVWELLVGVVAFLGLVAAGRWMLGGRGVASSQ